MSHRVWYLFVEGVKNHMRDKSGAGNARREPDEMPDEEIRVTDRRRINLDNLDRETDEKDVASAAPPRAAATVGNSDEYETRARAAEQKLIEVQTRFDQLRAQLQRETDETRQRLNRAADERALRGKVEFISALLPVLDNLQRAIDAANREGATLDSLLNGLQGTAHGFESALTTAGAEPLGVVGAAFDPETQEAVDTTPVEASRDGIVTAEYSRGYKLGDRLLRPARVQVGRAIGSNAQSASE